MSINDTLNASVKVVEGSLDESRSYLRPLKQNETLIYGTEHDLLIRCCFSLWFTFIYLWACMELFKYFKRSESWYCIYHWLVVSFLSQTFCVTIRINHAFYPMLKEEQFLYLKHGRRYLLTLYAYVLVTLALYSYNLVFKTFLKSSLSRLQWCKILVGLYIFCSFPTIYFVCVYGWIDVPTSGMGYLPNSWNFAHYPGEHNMTFLLLSHYIIPMCLTIFLLGKVSIELARRKEFYLFDETKAYSLCVGDRKLIAISYFTCITFVITSVPLIVQETIRSYVNPNYFHKDTIGIIDIYSGFNVYIDSIIIMILECLHRWIRWKNGDPDREWFWDDYKLCTYDPAAVQFSKRDSRRHMSSHVKVGKAYQRKRKPKARRSKKQD
ncbi:uncharacterized protein NPIL_430891 [Nephila pilipes]|uniref:Uncharacterized protein n=1 Tax=Nephila pilipes TaxID=299642 RepID=A0A8X6QVM4_NEPPI|nr:uncharacterized protein NPIL_430891 [Nephila pilipes]